MARDTTISPAAAAAAAAAGAAPGGVIDVTRLRVALARLSRRLRRHQLAGLTATQLAALATVERAGPLRLGDLAAAEGIAPSTLTRIVAVLEEAGYVRRGADPKDARASTVSMTPGGVATLEQLRQEGTALLTEWLALLSPGQRDALAAALPALEALSESGPATPGRVRTAAGLAASAPSSAARRRAAGPRTGRAGAGGRCCARRRRSA